MDYLLKTNAIIGNNKFILSDEKKYRIRRHIFFWVFWGLWFALVRELNPRFLKEFGHLPNPVQTVAESFLMLMPRLFWFTRFSISFCLAMLLLQNTSKHRFGRYYSFF